MSDVSQGPGWWLASDGKWYSPQQVPGESPPPPPPGASAAYGGYGVRSGVGTAPATPGYNSPPRTAVPAVRGVPAGMQGAPIGYAPSRTTNGMAIASFVCAWLWVFGVGSVLAVVFGFIALGQIRRANGGQNGKVLAIFGVILGFVGIASDVLWIIWISVLASHVTHCLQSTACSGSNTGNT